MLFFLTHVNKDGTVTLDATRYGTLDDAVRSFRALPPAWRVDGWIDNESGERVADKALIDALDVGHVKL